MMEIEKQGRHWLPGAVFTFFVIGLVFFTVGEGLDFYGFLVFLMLVFGIAGFHFIFPGSRFFVVAFANGLAVYACLYLYFMSVNFMPVPRPVVPVGYALPVAGFLLGAWLRRARIRTLVDAPRLQETRHLGRVFAWLVPVFAIGGLTFLLPGMDLTVEDRGILLLLSMALIALIVMVVSRDVTIFLLDTGLLFDQFFVRMAALAAPALAFLTLYSLLVIIFACIYRLIDRFSDAVNFMPGGQATEISFSDALYFSIVTLSTVGYGELVPVSEGVRIVVSIQIVMGALLLLFGFSEIIGYAREQRDRHE